MLDCGGDDVLAAVLAGICRAAHRPVIRFRAAAGEVNLVGLCADCVRNLLARLFNRDARFTAERVNRHGIAENFTEIRLHRFHNRLGYARGRCVVHINAFH